MTLLPLVAVFKGRAPRSHGTHQREQRLSKGTQRGAAARSLVPARWCRWTWSVCLWSAPSTAPCHMSRSLSYPLMTRLLVWTTFVWIRTRRTARRRLEDYTTSAAQRWTTCTLPVTQALPQMRQRLLPLQTPQGNGTTSARTFSPGARPGRAAPALLPRLVAPPIRSSSPSSCSTRWRACRFTKPPIASASPLPLSRR